VIEGIEDKSFKQKYFDNLTFSFDCTISEFLQSLYNNIKANRTGPRPNEPSNWIQHNDIANPQSLLLVVDESTTIQSLSLDQI
jgi:hypothetical protein